MTYSLRVLFLFLGVIGLSGCSSSTGNPFSSNGQSIVDAPLFSESRLYFVGQAEESNGSIHALVPQRLPIDSGTERIKPNSPLTVTVESVTLPRKGLGQDPMDILIIVDVGTKSDGSINSLAVFYERNVLPGRSLDFENLIIHNEPRWDERVSPYFRIRLLDMRLEKNQAVKNMLGDIQAFSTSIGSLLPYPGAAPVLGIAGKVAQLALSNKKNRAIADFTFQLHSSTVVGASGNSSLGELRRGSFMAVGLPNTMDRDFWKTSPTLKYNVDSRDVLYDQKIHNTPIAKLNVSTAETVVPKIIVQRTINLTKMFQSLANSVRPDALKEEIAALKISVDNFALSEKVRRYKYPSDVKDLGSKLNNANLYDSEEVFFMIRALESIAQGKKFSSPTEAAEWAAQYNGA